MAFQETNKMEQRVALLREYDLNHFSVAELCRRFGVSRDTFYYWKQRRDQGDADWFQDRSHATLNCPHAMPADTAQAILELRKRFKFFGPKKLRARLLLDRPGSQVPSASSIGALLKRIGEIEPRERRRPPMPQDLIEPVVNAPCDEWAIDFKGWFRTLDNVRCDPLTVTDSATRYLLAVQIIDQRIDQTRAVLTRLFQEHGLPDAIRSDNSAPFGSTGAGGFSKLSVWLMRQHIEPRWIPPGCPRDNSRHERMHRTLKAETSKPPARNPREQQVRFDDFVVRFNEQRPHEGMDQTFPAQHWRKSTRTFQPNPDEPWYDADHEVRRVRSDGYIHWHGEWVYLCEALSGELVGLAERENGGFLVRFMTRDLGLVMRKPRSTAIFHAFATPRHRRPRNH